MSGSGIKNRGGETGFALLSVIILAAFLMAILGAYFVLSSFERSTARSTMAATRGYYAAEAGANLRLDGLRLIFAGYNRPAGTSPPEVPGQLPCQGADQGSDDFRCLTYEMSGREVLTHVTEDAGNPTQIVIPRGELYQNLMAQEYGFDVRSVSVDADSHPGSILNLHLRSRLVPLFQFAAFYNKDLEILPGPAMFFEGPVHTNGDLYLDAGTSLTVQGQVTAVDKLYQGRKSDSSCNGAGVYIYDPTNPTALPACGGSRVELTPAEQAPWNGLVRSGVEFVDVPPPEALDPVPGEIYWDSADVRIMLDLNGGTPAVEVRDPAGNVDAASTTALNGCAGAVATTNTLYNHREADTIRTLDIDVSEVLDCLQANSGIIGGKPLDDATEGGLIWYLGVDGPDSSAVNNYGVRVIDGAELASTDPLAPAVRGLTVVTDQAIYVQGDFNATNKKPAAFLADSLNVLSNAWSDAVSADPLSSRIATSTEINAAFLAGTDTTGGAEGTAGQDSGAYNGGLENYPRFHESWSGRTLLYRGSFVSLGEARHVDGSWSDQSYSPPNRDWGYDTDFNDAAKLPPLSPRFVYVIQDLFVRDFEL